VLRRTRAPTRHTKQNHHRSSTPRASRSAKVINAVVTFVSVALGVLGLVVFWPRVTVEAAREIDPDAPQGISLKITNTGVLPLRNLQPAIGFGVLAPQGVPVPDLPVTGPFTGRLAFRPWFAKSLAMDEQYEIKLDATSSAANDGIFFFPPDYKLARLDFSLVLVFNPWIFPVRCEKEFKFATRIESNGKLSLMPQPINR
jgi:hypothetical protein